MGKKKTAIKKAEDVDLTISKTMGALRDTLPVESWAGSVNSATRRH